MSLIIESRKLSLLTIFASAGWLLGLYAGVTAHQVVGLQTHIAGVGLVITVIIAIVLNSHRLEFLNLYRKIAGYVLIALISSIATIAPFGLLGRLGVSILSRFPMWQLLDPWEGSLFLVMTGCWIVPSFFLARNLLDNSSINQPINLPATTLIMISLISAAILVDTLLPLSWAIAGLYIGTGVGAVVLIAPAIYSGLGPYTFDITSLIHRWLKPLTNYITINGTSIWSGITLGFWLGCLVGIPAGATLNPNISLWVISATLISFSVCVLLGIRASNHIGTSLLMAILVLLSIAVIYGGAGLLIDVLVMALNPGQGQIVSNRIFYSLLSGTWFVPAFIFAIAINRRNLPSWPSIISFCLLFQAVVLIIAIQWNVLSAITGIIASLIATISIIQLKSTFAWLKKNKHYVEPHFFSRLVARKRKSGQQTIKLNDNFRFAHEPTFFENADYHGKNSMERFIGREAELHELIQRIILSSGGAFLITGYRGVGKTSFVNRAIWEVKQHLPWLRSTLGPVEILDIHLNLARAFTAAELMFYLIRSMRSRLIELGFYGNLDRKTKEALEFAAQRTSMNIARKSGQSRESGLNLSDVAIGLNVLGGSTKFSIFSKKTASEGLDISFLAYDDKSAEHDILTLSRQLSQGFSAKVNLFRRCIHVVRRTSPPRTRLIIIYVFDELDKLEDLDNPDTVATIDMVLKSLKNLFTSSGISFIFIAGKDLQEKWAQETSKGDSVYESVFAYHKYLAAMWAEADLICDSLVQFDDANKDDATSTLYHDFKKYLAFIGRGIPRRILRGFNRFVIWDGRSPFLSFAPSELRYIRFYARLQEVIEAEVENLLADNSARERNEVRDKYLLGIYYLLDWILNQGGRTFSDKDLSAAAKKLSHKIAPSVSQEDELLQKLVEILVRHNYLEAIERVSNEVIIEQPAGVSIPLQRYRLPKRRLVEIGRSREELEDELGLKSNVPTALNKVGWYDIVSPLGQGGVAEVYHARDTRNGRDVALKLLFHGIDSYFGQKFWQEIRILQTLDHPNIVEFYDYGEHEGRRYYAMEFVDGVSLRDVLRNHEKLDLNLALAIFLPLLEALEHVHEKKIVWRDIKPENILISHEGRVYLVDPGIGKIGSEEMFTRPGMLIGTPDYMSYEQIIGGKIDNRSDIYALGIVLYEMLTGTRPFTSNDSALNTIAQHIHNLPESPLNRNPTILPNVSKAILRCLEKNKERRFPDVSALRASLPSPLPIDIAAVVALVTREDTMWTVSAPTEDGRELVEDLWDIEDGQVMQDQLENSVNVHPQFSPNAYQPSLPVDEYHAYYELSFINRALRWLQLHSIIRTDQQEQLPQLVIDPTAYRTPTLSMSVEDGSTQIFYPPPPLPPLPSSYSWPSPHPSHLNLQDDQRPQPLPRSMVPNQPYLTVVEKGRDNQDHTPTDFFVLLSSDSSAEGIQHTVRIGRSAENDIVLSVTDEASRYHAELDIYEHKVVIRDLNSLHGTFVNGGRIAEQELSDSDLIKIGAAELRFYSGGSSTSAVSERSRLDDL
jgi:serine/threonine protein kinase